MNRKVFVDTSAWLAYSSPHETGHTPVSNTFNHLFKSNYQLFTSNDIVDESITRFNTQAGWHLTQKLINYFQKSLSTKSLTSVWTNQSIQSMAFQLLEKYQDHRLSLTDATSAVLMKKLNITTILTLDTKHFTTLGFQVLPTP